jgi:predicted Zn-dependent peptidase
MPRIDRGELSNGTPVYVVPSSSKDILTITLALDHGSTRDVIQGDTSMTMQMLTLGAAGMDASAFADEVESRGCCLRASTSHDSSSLQVTGLGEWFEDAARLMASCIREPRFDADELEKLKTRTLADIMIDCKDVDWLAARAAGQGAYGDHPYARAKDGTPHSLAKITVDHLRNVHALLLRVPRRIIVAGPITIDRALPVLESLFGPLPSSGHAEELALPTIGSGIAVIADNDEAVQTAFRMILPSVSMHHPDYAAVQLITTVFGGYSLARLFTILREEKGYTYGAYASPHSRQLDSSIIISTSVGNEFTADTMATIAAEVERLGSQIIPDEELENARQYIVGSFARSCETPQQTAYLLYTLLQFDLPYDHYEQYIQRVQQLTASDLLEVQRRIYDRSRWVVGAAGVASEIEYAIAPFTSEVRLWNAQGY